MDSRPESGQIMTAAEECLFSHELRHVLNHLYDPTSLRGSPFVTWLGLAETVDPAQSVRRIMRESIDALMPSPGTSLNAPCYRAYQVLLYRYVQGLTHEEVGSQLGLSVRQIRREQALAIESLASWLREHFSIRGLDGADATASRVGEEVQRESNQVADELAWLRGSMSGQSAWVLPSLQRAIGVSETLAHEKRVNVRLAAIDRSAVAAVASTVLDQIILNLVTAAISAAPGGDVLISLSVEANGVVVGLACALGRDAESSSGWDEESTDMSRQLVIQFGGVLEVGAGDTELTATLTFPLVREAVVLAVEDNPHTLELWQRYLEGTTIRLVPLTDPQNALAKAIDLQPAALILDVMMPGGDGWGLLSQFRHHPNTHHIPVIVCTVLPQKDLALSLGAADFIQKPAVRATFRAVLERQIAAGGQAASSAPSGQHPSPEAPHGA